MDQYLCKDYKTFFRILTAIDSKIGLRHLFTNGESGNSSGRGGRGVKNTGLALTCPAYYQEWAAATTTTVYYYV